MKHILLTSILLSMTVSAFAQDSSSFRVIAWKMEHNITYIQIQTDGFWCAFALSGEHLNDVRIMITEGCVLRKSYALSIFDPVRGLRYVGKGDEKELKELLGIDKICNK